MNERPCGRLGQHTISHCADRAARLVRECSVPRAVCLDPDGRVTVEAPSEAIADEMVGVYDSSFGQFELWRMISDDLLAAKTERAIDGGSNQRHRVESRTYSAARYEGIECRKCGGKARYASNNRCVACADERRSSAKRAATVKRAA